jgi:hypothetical protein
MEYFKEINLPSWPMLQQFCLKKWDGTFNASAMIFKDRNLDCIASTIEHDIANQLGVKAKVKTAIMFINDANFVQDIHVDGFDLKRVNAANTALNLPVLNCDHGPMYWYDGDYYLTETENMKLKYLKINWREEPALTVVKIINRPTFVKIDIPHHVENRSSKPRLMLSIRFTEDFLLENIPPIV